jgi:GT2 family glycosyltransferase
VTVPVLSVVIPTHSNEAILRRCLLTWERFGPAGRFELIVVEDGCTDGTATLLESLSSTPFGRQHVRSIHLDDVHELRCTNAGLRAAAGQLVMAWQDDMLLEADWLMPEVIRIFECHQDIGMMSLSRGLDHFPSAAPLDTWDALNDWSRLRSTIGPIGLNWFRVQEVDTVIRPWLVRRECLERVGLLDEAFVPTEWDEADLAFRIRAAGWKVGTCGYERLGGYHHLGSSTVGQLSDAYRARVLNNGRLFHQRWDGVIARDHARVRQRWRRPQTGKAWLNTCRAIVTRGIKRARETSR